ncbi:hypothetical protein ACHAWU_009898 [Discostella pseudostelligera]|uniref:REJ domain-containing protein n=1 Tax=Discostella pseudostelligera TaxID=259834 RepID=A0ABD3LXP9_9STRA
MNPTPNTSSTTDNRQLTTESVSSCRSSSLSLISQLKHFSALIVRRGSSSSSSSISSSSSSSSSSRFR